MTASRSRETVCSAPSIAKKPRIGFGYWMQGREGKSPERYALARLNLLLELLLNPWIALRRDSSRDADPRARRVRGGIHRTGQSLALSAYCFWLATTASKNNPKRWRISASDSELESTKCSSNIACENAPKAVAAAALDIGKDRPSDFITRRRISPPQERNPLCRARNRA